MTDIIRPAPGQPPPDDSGKGTGGEDHAAMGRKQVRGSSLLVVGRVAAMVISFATQVLIVRALTKTDYGGFAYALAVAAAARTLLSLGQGKLLSRFMATYEEQRDYNRMFGAMFLAVGTVAVTSVVFLGSLFLLQDALVGTAVNSRQTVDLLLILIFVAPLEALDQVFVSLFAVFTKPRAIFFRKYLLAPGLRLVVVLALVITDQSATFLAVGYVLAGAVGIALYAWLFVRALRERGLSRHLNLRRVQLPFRAVFAFSVPLITSELVLLSLNVGGALVLEFYHGPIAVADYRSVFNSARLNTAITAAFVTLFLPVAARLYARADIDSLRRNYWHTAVFMAVLTFPIFALTGPLATQTTVVLFGERYAESGTVLALLAVGYYFNAILGFNAFALQVFGRLRYLIGVNVVVMALNIGLLFFLIPDYGAVGAAAANCAALVCQNVLNQLALRRSLRTRFIEPGYVRCYLVIVGCSAALWGLQERFEYGLGIGLVTVVFASVAVFLVSRNQLQLADTFPELTRVPVVRRLIR